MTKNRWIRPSKNGYTFLFYSDSHMGEKLSTAAQVFDDLTNCIKSANRIFFFHSSAPISSSPSTPTWITLTEFSRNSVTTCLLYTSDAADDLLCVDFGGRRIIK